MVILYESEYLAHHGVKGQKWGVRRFQNPDGSLTPAGRARLYKNIKSDFELENKNRGKRNKISSIYDEDRLTGKKTAKRGSIYEKMNDELSKDRDEYKKALEPYKEFNSNPELVESYQKKAARKFWEEEGQDWTLDAVEDWYMYDDGDQGEYSSFNLYCKDKGIDADKLYKDAHAAEKKYLSQCENVANKYLSEYGEEPMTNQFGFKSTVSKVVSDMLLDLADDSMRFEGYYIDF